MSNDEIGYTAESLDVWLRHPVTTDLMRALMEYQEDLKGAWARGNLKDWEENIHSMGRTQGIQDVFDIVEQLKDRLNETEEQYD